MPARLFREGGDCFGAVAGNNFGRDAGLNKKLATSRVWLARIDWAVQYHESRHKRRKTTLGRALENAVGKPLTARLPPKLGGRLNDLFYFGFSTPVVRPSLSADLRTKLLTYLKPDVARLRALTGESFKTWTL